jgi:hypothetical protein
MHAITLALQAKNNCHKEVLHTAIRRQDLWDAAPFPEALQEIESESNCAYLYIAIPI